MKNDLLKLKVGEEIVIGIFETDCGKTIMVNPKIYYKGTKVNEIKFLEDMFKIKY